MFDIDKPLVGKEEIDALIECVNDGSIAQGKLVHKFEEEFAKYCGIKYSCAAMNGTSALHLALLAVGIKPGDEVLVPSLTFVASVSPISYCGATPVFVDCDPVTWCMDAHDLEKKITPKSKAVIPVHLYGNACRMDAITAAAKKHGLKIVEDCAEAHGTTYKNKQVGVFSDVCFFSFYKNKHMMTGEGGMCLTNDRRLIEKIGLLRSHGKEKSENLSDEDFAQKQFISSEIGYNYRMTDLQAAVGLAQLKKVETFITRRIGYARLYGELFKGTNLTLPGFDKDVRHTFWGFPVLLASDEAKVRAVIEFRKRGMRLRSFFNPCHMQPFYKKYKSTCPVSEDVSRRGVLLPNIHSMKEEDIRTIAKWLKELL
ncbi:MAG: DegT/DnrJ/EryC1/StrS family aminotransferase [Candidatus Omnitrophica bacterium]|nr:DegT/DnrJ/EryC1/StrS family aminotransferase [Candidatus Omnitrophota bacterium]